MTVAVATDDCEDDNGVLADVAEAKHDGFFCLGLSAFCFQSFVSKSVFVLVFGS